NVLADRPPVALGQTQTMTENKSLSLFLSGNDSDFDRLTFTIFTQPSSGKLTGTPPSVTYTPNPDFVGTDSFTFKVNDGEIDSDPGTVTINVIANRPPVAFTQSVATAFNTPVIITLRGTDPDFDTLTFSLDTTPVNGVLSAAPPNLVYAPNTGFVGPDAFSFVTNDGKLISVAATVSLTVRGPCSSIPIGFGETKTADLSDVDCFAPHHAGTPADLYTFSGTAGQAVRITMTGGFGTFLVLQGTSGTVVANSASCSGVSGASCIPFRAASGDVFILPAAGLYTIEATSISATAVGNYTLNLTLVPQFMLSVTKQGTGSGTVQSSPSGINCGSDCSEPFLMGRGVNLFESPSGGSLFMGWTGGGCSGTSSSCFVTMNSDTTVTATFQPPVFIAEAAPNGGEVWRIGSMQTVRWTSNGVNGFVNVQLSRDGGATWKTIIKKASNTGAQNWKAAKAATTRGRVRICSLSMPSICGASTADFTIQ